MDSTQAQEEFLHRLRTNPVHRAGGVALHWQSAELIREAIEALHYPPAVPLPPEKELAAALGVSRPTLRQAMARLANEGFVHAQRGIGTFALRGSLVRPATLASLYDDLRRAGRQTSSRIIAMGTVRADVVLASSLRLEPGRTMKTVKRVRYAEGNAVALIDSALALPPGVDFTAEELAASGLYHLLQSKAGIELVSGQESVIARIAADDEAEALGIAPGSAVLAALRYAFDSQGRGIERSAIVYPSGTELFLSDLRGAAYRSTGAETSAEAS